MKKIPQLILIVLSFLLVKGCASTANYSHYDLGIEYEKMGRMENAIQEYQKSLTIDPEDPTVHEALANAYHKQKYIEQSISQWEQVLKYGSENAADYHKSGKPKRSAQWIQDGIQATRETKRKLQIAYFAYATDLNEQGRSGEAMEVFNKLVRLNPRHLEGWKALGWIYKRQKDNQNAYEAWKNAAEIASTDSESQNQLGYAAFATGRMEEALQAFRQYIVLNPQDPVGHNNAGAVLAKMEKFPESLAHYDKALTLSPDLISSLNGKATAYYYKKDYEQARALWQKVLAKEPDNETAKRNIRTLVSMGY
jgi:tetratricopeptide (TPR) repeat protein